MASVCELKKSFFAEIDKVENREDLEKLRVKYLGREKGISHGSFAFAWRYTVGCVFQRAHRSIHRGVVDRTFIPASPSARLPQCRKWAHSDRILTFGCKIMAASEERIFGPRCRN